MNFCDIRYAIINYPFIMAVETLLGAIPCGRDREYLSPVVRHSLITATGMVILVFINLQFSGSDGTQQLFGLCGGWGVTFIV